LTDEDKVKQANEAAQQLAHTIMRVCRQVYDTIKNILGTIIKSQVVTGRYVPKHIPKVMTLKSQVYYRPVRQVARSRC
jgi:hypothetical protein